MRHKKVAFIVWIVLFEPVQVAYYQLVTCSKHKEKGKNKYTDDQRRHKAEEVPQ
jgi:hypothetical protein